MICSEFVLYLISKNKKNVMSNHVLVKIDIHTPRHPGYTTTLDLTLHTLTLPPIQTKTPQDHSHGARFSLDVGAMRYFQNTLHKACGMTSVNPSAKR